MNITEKDLRNAAREERVHPEILEKSLTLLSLLDAIEENTSLCGKFALKGGTALNLFHFDAPRLSLDIDLNYVGSASLEAMKEDRPIVENELKRVYESLGMNIERSATAHAGGKYEIRYPSTLNRGKGSIEVDLNYMYRVPLLPLEYKQSAKLGGRQSNPILLMSFEETVAGKLSALLDRDVSRDLFDMYYILSSGREFDKQKLKAVFLAYYIMEDKKKTEISLQSIQVNPQDVIHKLRPVLRSREELDSDKKCIDWAKNAAREVKTQLKDILDLGEKEKTFLEQALNHGKTDFSLITEDQELISRLEQHPKIQWMKQKKLQGGRGLRM